MESKNKFKQTEIGQIPKCWKIDMLENHVIIKGRIGWKGLKISEYGGDGPLIIGGLQIKEESIAWKECAHITKKRYEESPEIILQIKDILMTKDGTIGKLAYIDKLPNKATVASHIHVIRKNSNEILSLFLFYFFKSTRFQNLIESKISGSVVPSLTQKDINKTFFPLPLISEQEKISKILSDLDSKIKLNQEMTKTLEEIAQAIFKHWFIDFEFPDKNRNSYKSHRGKIKHNEMLNVSIPKNWTVSKIGDVLKIILGGTPSRMNEAYWKNGTEAWINSGKINEFRITIPTTYITKQAVLNSSTKMLPKGTTVLAITGATLGQVSRIEINTCTNQSVIGIIKSQNIPSEYIYNWIKHTINKIIRYQTGGAQQHINQKNVKNSEILIPTKNIMQLYQQIVNPIFERISLSCFEINELTKMRDSLLPKLMSGQIRIMGDNKQ